MSDAANGTKGVQAYRWLVTIGMALIVALSWRVLDQVDKMAAKLEALQIQVTTLSSTSDGRTNAHTLRLDGADKVNERQDLQIHELQRQFWRMTPARQPEDQQRQLWQQK